MNISCKKCCLLSTSLSSFRYWGEYGLIPSYIDHWRHAWPIFYEFSVLRLVSYIAGNACGCETIFFGFSSLLRRLVLEIRVNYKTWFGFFGIAAFTLPVCLSWTNYNTHVVVVMSELYLVHKFKSLTTDVNSIFNTVVIMT